MMVSAFDPAVPIDRMKKRAAEQTLDTTENDGLSQQQLQQSPVSTIEKGGEHVSIHRGKEKRPMLFDESDDDDTEETEDEEVKMNCIGGLNAVRDSDMSDDDDDNRDDENDDDDSDEDDEDMSAESDGETADDGVVTFVSGKTLPVGVQKPTPVVRRLPQENQEVTFPPAATKEVNDDNDDDDSDDAMSSSSSDSESSSSSSSIGARGIGLSLETTTPASGDDDDVASSDDDEESLSDEDSEEQDEEDESEMITAEKEEEDDELEVSDTSDVDEDGQDDNNDEESSGDEQESEEEQDVGEADDSRDDMMVAEKVPLHETNDAWGEGAPGDMGAGSAPLRRPSFNVDDIEEMLDQDMAGNGTFPSTGDLRDKASEDLNEMLSDALEFDYWSSETLAAAVDTLASVSNDSEAQTSSRDYPIGLPHRDDTEFWLDKMGLAIFSESRLKEYLSNNPDQRLVASRIMFDSFHAELMSLDITHIILPQKDSSKEDEQPVLARDRSWLFVGPFAAAESRLALAVLNMKRVIQISYHPLDELWPGDGVKYSTHVLPSLGNDGAPPVHEAIQEGAEEVACTWSEGASPCSVLVTCSTGDEHSCAVCAVYLAKRMGIPVKEAAAKIAEQRSSCRIDPEWLRSDDDTSSGRQRHKTKRVLSSNKLTGMNNPAHGLGFGSPKRMRCARDSGTSATVPLLPALSLGPAAKDQNQSAVGLPLKMRGSEDYISSSTESEEEREQDMRLSEELEDAGDAESVDRPSTPVPLLTPPASPVRVESEEGGTTTVCEWPSNLTVDSAMTAAIDLRPLSPNSLQKQEEEEEKRIVSNTSVEGMSKNNRKPMPPQQSTLTPLIRGISVKFD